MIKQTISIFITLVVVFLCANVISAQTDKSRKSLDNQNISKKQLEKFFSEANESAIVENGKVSFMKLPIANEGEKLFTFNYADDRKGFAMSDESGVKIQVNLYEDNRVRSVIMPSGDEIVLKWERNSQGEWIPSDGEKCNNLMASPEGNPCRDAAVASAIALGVCAATGGLSVPCIAATANAAYQTYKCYESTQSIVIDPNPVDKNLLNCHKRILLSNSFQQADKRMCLFNG